MPNYKITLTVPAARIDMVRKMCQSAFGKDVSAQVTKIEQQPSRGERLADAEGWVADAKNVVTELRDEMESWRDNMPETLRGGPKMDEIEECISALEEVESALDGVDFDGVSFPSMM